jgi:hypothetical protein
MRLPGLGRSGLRMPSRRTRASQPGTTVGGRRCSSGSTVGDRRCSVRARRWEDGAAACGHGGGRTALQRGGTVVRGRRCSVWGRSREDGAADGGGCPLPGSPRREPREYGSLQEKRHVFPHLTVRASRQPGTAVGDRRCSSDTTVGGRRSSAGTVVGERRSSSDTAVGGRRCSVWGRSREDGAADGGGCPLPGSPRREPREYGALQEKRHVFPHLKVRASRQPGMNVGRDEMC